MTHIFILVTCHKKFHVFHKSKSHNGFSLVTWLIKAEKLCRKTCMFDQRKQFKFTTKCDGIITNCDSFVYYKVQWTVITNCDSLFITKCNTVHYKLRHWGFTKSYRFITTCDNIVLEVVTSRCQNFWMTTSRQTSRKTVSDFIDLVQFELICQMLAKFSGVKSERTVFTLRKRKINCVVST